MLHVHPNGVQVQAAPAMEADHLPHRRGRAEVGPYLVPKRTVLPSAADDGDRSQDSGPFFHTVVVVAVDAGQDLVWVVKLDLHNVGLMMNTVYNCVRLQFWRVRASNNLPCVLSGHHFHAW